MGEIDEGRKKKDFFDYIRPYSVRYVRPVFNFVSKNRILSVFILFTSLFFLFVLNQFFVLMKNTLVISSLILLGGISNIYQRYVRVHLGIEFIMLATVMCGYLYGSFVGAIVGVLTLTLAMYFEGRFRHTLFVSYILIILVGILSSTLKNHSITFVGIVLTIFYDIILVPVYIGLFRARIPAILTFAITHVIWNWWVFSSIAPSLLQIIT